MAQSARQQFTYDEYLRLEEAAATKHEFFNGEVWAMAGGSPAHAGIAANVVALLSRQLEGKPCRAFTSDLRVRVVATGLGTYPDVSVVCGKLETDPADPRAHTAINPRVLVEILSPSTENYDRGEKLGHYKHIASLAEIVLVAHDRQEIEIVRREVDGSWSRHVAGEGQSAELVSLGCALDVAAVYRDPLAG